MNNILIKSRRFYAQHMNPMLVGAILFFWTSLTYAAISKASGNNDAAFANGYFWLDSVMHGYLGILLAAAAFVVSLIIGIAKQSPMAVVGGIIFALLIAFGLDMVVGIVNSSLVNDDINNNSLVSSLIGSAIVICTWFALSAKHNKIDKIICLAKSDIR